MHRGKRGSGAGGLTGRHAGRLNTQGGIRQSIGGDDSASRQKAIEPFGNQSAQGNCRDASWLKLPLVESKFFVVQVNGVEGVAYGILEEASRYVVASGDRLYSLDCAGFADAAF